MNDFYKEFKEFLKPDTEGSYCELWKFCRVVLAHVRHLERQIKAKNKIIEKAYEGVDQ